MEAQFKHFIFKATQKDGTFGFVASTEDEDRYGDIIRADGWDLTHFKANPVFLWSHDNEQPPIGRVERIWVEGKRLLADVKFAEHSFAVTIRKMYEGGYLNAVSVGFKPVEWRPRDNGGIEFLNQELLELSGVSVPANASALARALFLKSITPHEAQQFVQRTDNSVDAALRRLGIFKESK